MFKKLFLALIITFAAIGSIQAQNRYYTKTGKVDFFSNASVEDIEAKNKTVTAVLDAKTGAVQFKVQMKGFEFEKDLMQKHFNDKYVESTKYPTAEFKGSVNNNAAITYNKDGTYNVSVKGKLTLHGVTKDVQASGSLKVAGGNIEAVSTFNILLSDYNVSIEPVVKDKISNSIKITVSTKLEPQKS